MNISAKRCGTGAAIMLTLTTMITAAQPTAKPKRILVIGDSMMQVTAHAFNRRLDRIPDVENRNHTSLGSGLARLDVFDWLEKIQELVDDFDPDATVVWFGANDLQPMQTAGGIIRPGSPEWSAEYQRRVGAAMDRLTKREGAYVYWLELPDMRDRRVQSDVAFINSLLVTAAGNRERAFFVPTRTILSREPGTYSPYIVGPRGMPVQIRDPDGIHLNRAGADLMTEHLLELILGDK